MTVPMAWTGKQAATCDATAKHAPKPSPGHKPSLPEKPQPCHRKTGSLQCPGRSEVTLPPSAPSARYGFLPLMKYF